MDSSRSRTPVCVAVLAALLLAGLANVVRSAGPALAAIPAHNAVLVTTREVPTTDPAATGPAGTDPATGAVTGVSTASVPARAPIGRWPARVRPSWRSSPWRCSCWSPVRC